MAIADGSVLYAADLNLLPRPFATVAARDAFYTANPGLKLPGIVAVIGTGADYAEYRWDGAGWVRSAVGGWQAFTPSWAGLTLGNGATSGRWCRVGNTVLVNISLAFGSTTAMPGNAYPQITAPLPAPQYIAAGSGVAFDSSASDFRPLTWLANDWVVSPSGRISSAIPWVWAAGDYIRLSIAYEAAA